MFRKLAVVVVALSLSGCTSRYAVVTGDPHTRMMEEFKSGKPNLTCQIACVFNWLSNFRKMNTLHNASQWEPLAELVMEVGHEKDISYYFLGKAAEGLGYYDAAARYYRYGLELCNSPNKFHHCRDVQSGNYCGGLDLATVLPELIASTQTSGRTQSQIRPQSTTQLRTTVSVSKVTGGGFEFSVQEAGQEEFRNIFEPNICWNTMNSFTGSATGHRFGQGVLQASDQGRHFAILGAL